MCCPGISFTNLNIKILGPSISGQAVDDLADLIDGDGDGKCREANGNFIPCPPKALVAGVRELRQRLQRDQVPPGYRAQATRDLDLAVSRMRQGRHDAAREIINEVDGALRGGGIKPSKPTAAPKKPPVNPEAAAQVRRFLGGGLGNGELDRMIRNGNDDFLEALIPALDELNWNPGVRRFRELVDEVRNERRRNAKPVVAKPQAAAGNGPLLHQDAAAIARAMREDPVSKAHLEQLTIMKRSRYESKYRERYGEIINQIRASRAAKMTDREIADSIRTILKNRQDAGIGVGSQIETDAEIGNFAHNAALDRLARLVEKGNFDLDERVRQAAPAAPAAPRRGRAVVPQVPQVAQAAPAAGMDLDEIIKTRRTKAAEKAKLIRDNAKKYIPIEVRDYFKRRSLQNRDQWLTGTPAEKRTKLQKWASRMFTFTVENKNGVKYKSQVDSVSADESTISISGRVLDKNGRKVGEWSRTLYLGSDKPYVYHNVFKVDEPYRKEGLGSAFIAAAELSYKAAGFDSIKVSGLSQPGWNGATQWPKNGFDWANSGAKSQVLSAIRAAVMANDDGIFSDETQRNVIKALLERAQNESLTDPNRVIPADLLDFPGAEKVFKDLGSMISYIRKL
jgi:hypothetical protein